MATPVTTRAMQTATPVLRIKNAAAAIDFYINTFDAREIMRFDVQGTIAHAELAIGNAQITLGEADAATGYGGPEAFGGSPMSIHLYVDDVDAFINRAVAAGATLKTPPQDQFYGDRSGSIVDPFGYTWLVATRVEEMPVEEMYRRFDAMMGQPPKSSVNPIREGFRTLTPYMVAADAASLVDFIKQTFGAEEKFRSVGSAGGMHCEMLLGDSMMMIGGGAPGLAWRGESGPMAFHVYVPDVDATYRKALDAGATTLQEPADQPWNERTANIKDAAGNFWYIATYKGKNYFWEGAPTVQPYLHPRRAEPVINFLKRAFGASEMGRSATPEGVIQHTTLKLGNSLMELTEADGPYQPMPSMFYLYVPDVDATYRTALAAGAKSIQDPATQPYGDHTVAVKDPFGNQWYLATHIADVPLQ